MMAYKPVRLGLEEYDDVDDNMISDTLPVPDWALNPPTVEASENDTAMDDSIQESKGLIDSTDDDDEAINEQPKGEMCRWRSCVMTMLALGAVFGSTAAAVHNHFLKTKTKSPLATRDNDSRVQHDSVEPNPAHAAALEAFEKRPPLSELVVSGEIQQDVSYLLDFAIVGFAKSGTTYLKNWLKHVDELFLNNGEICKMGRDLPEQVVQDYYNVSHRNDAGHRRVVGLKCPKDLETEHAQINYARHFPNTDFIVTTRHPVNWFRSFYNFRTYQRYPTLMPDPHELIGACVPDSLYVCPFKCETGNQNVCSDRTNFHHALARLGKTPMNTPEELALLPPDLEVEPSKSRVFLMELNQLSTLNVASVNIPRDLGNFLQLDNGLPALRPYEGTHVTQTDSNRTQLFIDICEEQYQDIREVLIENGRRASVWIRDYFLKSPDVYVSSEEKFVELIERWGEDPCDARDDHQRYF